MRTITLNSGKRYECPLAGEDAGVLWLRLEGKGLSVQTVVPELNESVCKTIRWDFGSDMVIKWEGYTNLIIAKQNGEDCVEIALKQADS